MLIFKYHILTLLWKIEIEIVIMIMIVIVYNWVVKLFEKSNTML